ncbi:MAG: hypothetical protein HZA90_03840, partial [Verrucomicrobia bacterium]|nr:hypothetical protein [Verrucomicrobiota bacterium]
KPVTVRSLNGPAFTTIQGYQVPGTTNGNGAIRCVYLTNGAVLSGFTLTKGATRGWSGQYDWEQGGGGVWCASASALVTNCTLIGNSAGLGGGAYAGTLNHCTLTSNPASLDGGGAHSGTLNHCSLAGNSAYRYGGGAYSGMLNHCTLTDNSADLGGGTYSGTLNHCTLTGNSASQDGGGAYTGTLNHCTLAGNWATHHGGGPVASTLNNCIVFCNTAPNGPNYYASTFNYSCTTPLPSGPGNIAEEPRFVDANGWSNLRLQSNSPCINAGNNALVRGETDLEDNPRIVAGTVDLGAYEFQTPASVISYAWLQQFGLPTDGSVDFTDSDDDRLNNWQEWRCLTDPTNALSVLRLLPPAPASNNLTVSWQSVAGVNYFLERSTNLGASPPFQPLATNLAGQADTTTFTDTNADGALPHFYRVGVPAP